VPPEPGKATLLVATTHPPDRGPVALEPGGNLSDRLARGDSQDDASMLDLEPAQAAVARHCFEDRAGGVGQPQRVRLASSHGATSPARARACPHRTPRSQFVA